MSEMKKRYHVDYGRQKGFYKDAKDTYEEGEHVVFYYKFVATDTSYTFYLDGKELYVGFDSKEGFIIDFVMPPHDVTFSLEERNTMLDAPNR